MKILKLLICLCLLCAAVCLVACDGDKHTHSYTEKVVAATCTEQGYTEHTCSCGESYRDTYVPSAHTIVVDAAVAATCTTEGRTEGSHCSTCNTVMMPQESVPRTEHVLVDYVCTMCGVMNRATEGLRFQSVSGVSSLEYEVYLGDATDTHIYVPAYYNGAPVTHVGRLSTGSYNSAIETVTLPATITHINNHAFEYNRKMTQVNFAEGTKLQSIGNNAFSHCASLRELNLPDGVTEIGDNCFSFCVSLTSFKIPSGVTKLGSGTFNQCRGLLSITLPETLTEMEEVSFAQCNKLVEIYNLSSLTLQKGTENNGWVAKNAVVIHTQASEAGNILQSGDYYFLRDGEQYYLMHYAGKQTTLTLPDLINGHSYGLYANALRQEREDIYSLLIERVYLPATLQSIGDYAFANCEYLTQVNIPATVTEIGTGAFSRCYLLRDVGLGVDSALTTIGDEAFRFCYHLSKIVLGEQMLEIGTQAFFDCYSLVEVYDLSTALNVQKGDWENNGGVGERVMALHNEAWEESELIVQDDFLFIEDEQEQYFVLIDYLGTDTEVVLPENVNGYPIAIHEGAFVRYSSITSITASNVISVGRYAFYYCTSLTEAIFLDPLKELGYCAFSDCKALAAVQLPDTLLSINYAFNRCDSLTDVYYAGTEDEWESVQGHTDVPETVEIRYASVMPE